MISREIIETENHVRIFGIRFHKGGYPAVSRLLSNGGLMVAPSAPSLVPICNDSHYHASLQASDVAIPDSGLMVLLLKYWFRINLQRVSGLEFLDSYLREHVGDSNIRLFLVEPTAADHEANIAYLDKTGVPCKPDHYYVAPMYTGEQYSGDVLRDEILLERIEALRPNVILINLGGGTQERLGHFLQEHLSYRPTIICTGAAIAFLSGRQVGIPAWADRLYLGWLFRCCSAPRRFIPRYFGSIRLVSMFLGCCVRKA